MPARQDILVRNVAPLLKRGQHVLEIGAGSGRVSEGLARATGAHLTLLDVVDYNASALPLRVYDGKRVPFPDEAFDLTLLVFVLHHNPDPRPILQEALRVSRGGLVIVENDVRGALRKTVTRWIDSIEPWRLGAPPCYCTKSAEEWLALFGTLAAHAELVRRFEIGWFWQNAVFVVSR